MPGSFVAISLLPLSNHLFTLVELYFRGIHAPESGGCQTGLPLKRQLPTLQNGGTLSHAN
jgi:hypothetical protein